MSVSDRPIANPIVVLREEFDDWAVLFNPNTADAIGINPVGVTVWKLMDGKSDLNAIAVRVQAEYDEAPESAPEELESFIDSLAQRGFVGYELTEFSL